MFTIRPIRSLALLLLLAWPVLGGSPTLVGKWRADDIPTCGDFSPDGGTFVFGTELGSLSVVDLATKKVQPPVAAHPGGNGVSAVRFTTDGKHLISGAWEKGEIKTWSLPGVKPGPVFRMGCASPIEYLESSRDGQLLVARAEDLVVIDRTTGAERFRRRGAAGAVCFDRGRTIFLGEARGVARIDAASGETTGNCEALKDAMIVDLAWAREPDELLVLTEAAELVLVDPATLAVRRRTPLASIPGFPGKALHLSTDQLDFLWFPGPRQLVVNDRITTAFVSRDAGAAVQISHGSSVGVAVSPAGGRHAILGGTRFAGPGAEVEHTWTVSVHEVSGR